MPLSDPSLGCVPKSIPHTLLGLAMDDLIDSAQSSDLQTNRLFQLEKRGVTATKPEPAVDDKSFLQATDVILNNGGSLLPERYLLPLSYIPAIEKCANSKRRRRGKKRARTNGSLLPFTDRQVLKINFHDNGHASWSARASELSHTE